MYLDIADRISQESQAIRSKVGAVIVKDGNIISFGWNGTPSGQDNTCETETETGLVTKPEVLHAESNALMKLVAAGGAASQGATLYTTVSPCFECSKLIRQAKVARVVYRRTYRNTDGLDLLVRLGVQVEQQDPSVNS